jgi:tetratricopeptide (TPR) repeat protein
MRFIAALALAAVAASAIDAAAQPSDATESVARRYFNDGVAAYRAGDFVKARDLFAKAHELVPGRDLVLFNLASAQARTDQLVEATRSFQKFLAATTAESQPAYRTKATAELADLEKRTPSVIIAVTNLAGGDRVTLGGQPFARALLGEEVPANPGAVKVVVLRDGAVVATGEAQLSEGDKRVAIEIRAPLDLEVQAGAEAGRARLSAAERAAR